MAMDVLVIESLMFWDKTMENSKIILIDTSYPINSRNYRIVKSLSEIFGHNNVRVIAWDRNGKVPDNLEENYSVFSRKAPLGDSVAKLKTIFEFKKYVKEALDFYDPKIIIASHWDSLMISSSIKKNGQILIYENLDIPSGNFLIRNILSTIERLSLRKVDAISYASRFFMPLYHHFKGKNIPLENKLTKLAIPENPQNNNFGESLKVMFNGAIRYLDSMQNLIEAIGDNKNIELLIYGYPVGNEGKIILEKAARYKNIHYMGSYKYNEIPSLYSKSDVVWGAYPPNDFNVKYAISNKFHESIAYKVPGIFSEQTKLGELVSLKKIGFTVDVYSVDAIKKLFENIINNREEVMTTIKKNLDVERRTGIDWESEFVEFKNYINNQLVDQ